MNFLKNIRLITPAFTFMLLSLGFCAFAKQSVSFRTELPGDSAISIYVGVKAKWTSHVSDTAQDRTKEFPTDVSAYDVSEIPTRANFCEHTLSLMPTPENPDWYVFHPANDRFSLTINIADRLKRLASMIVTNLNTGECVGRFKSAVGGARLRAKISLPWSQSLFRIDGFTREGSPLFRVAATNGETDRELFFTIPGWFTPERPATIASKRLPFCNGATGIEGDPYDFKSHKIRTLPGNYFSIGCAAVDQLNDNGREGALQPPRPYLDYLATIYQGGSGGFSEPSIAGHLSAGQVLSAKDSSRSYGRGVKDIVMPPYSDCTGHWHVKFAGGVTSYFHVPYTVARHKKSFERIENAFKKLSSEIDGFEEVPQDFMSGLGWRLQERFKMWTESGEGRTLGFKGKMATWVQDVKYINASSDVIVGAKSHEGRFGAEGDLAFASPILSETNILLTPSPIPTEELKATGSVEIKETALGVQGTPPEPIVGKFALKFVDGKAKAMLPKGRMIYLDARIVSPIGYQLLIDPLRFNTGFGQTIQSAFIKTPCLNLKIIANEPCTITVSKNNKLIASGSTSFIEEENVFNAGPVPHDLYEIKAVGVKSRVEKSAYHRLENWKVGRNLVQVVNLELK